MKQASEIPLHLSQKMIIVSNSEFFELALNQASNRYLGEGTKFEQCQTNRKCSETLKSGKMIIDANWMCKGWICRLNFPNLQSLFDMIKLKLDTVKISMTSSITERPSQRLLSSWGRGLEPKENWQQETQRTRCYRLQQHWGAQIALGGSPY